MVDFVTDAFIAMNFYAFLVTCYDKWHEGKHRKLFWAFTLCFGAIGSAITCQVIRHRTRSGEAGIALILALIQYMLYCRLF